MDWILAITAHIPNKGEQPVRYYGYYSNVSRGKRKTVDSVLPKLRNLRRSALAGSGR